MDTRSTVDAVTKALETTTEEFSSCQRDRKKVFQNRNHLFPNHDSGHSTDVSDNSPEHSDNSSSVSSNDRESSVKMTKDAINARIAPSSPITIPRLKVSHVEVMHDGVEYERIESPVSSIGDSVYDSPVLPRSSQDFQHVMIKLRHCSDIQRIRSCENVQNESSDGESCASSINFSTSLPHTGNITPKRRTVRFDEATITVAAELGESAARFRSRWRKKRTANASPSIRFGESKNISILHDESILPPNSPQLNRGTPDSGKSIFDVCNYSSYGRYT